VLVDVEGDGRLDYITNGGMTFINFRRGVGDGTLEPARQLPIPPYSISGYIAAGEFNHDGIADFVVHARNPQTNMFRYGVVLSNP
jgi:hypothetical protein